MRLGSRPADAVDRVSVDVDAARAAARSKRADSATRRTGRRFGRTGVARQRKARSLPRGRPALSRAGDFGDYLSKSRVTVQFDARLYVRGTATLIASWEEYAKGAVDASLQRLPGVAVAVFPNEPERSVYNNALLERRLPGRERKGVVEAMEAVYANAGVERFAAWVHESDPGMQRDLERRGYTLDASTRAMGIWLDDIDPRPPQVDLAPPNWSDHLRIAGVPSDFLAAADPTAYHVLLARLDGVAVATTMAFDLDGDCGIYNVGTLERARRRGLASALTAIQLHDARARGCETASLQATPMAERLYATAGFRDLGRFLEYVPPLDRNTLRHEAPGCDTDATCPRPSRSGASSRSSSMRYRARPRLPGDARPRCRRARRCARGRSSIL